MSSLIGVTVQSCFRSSSYNMFIVDKSEFLKCSYSADGGAMYISSPSVFLNVSKSIFSECSSTGSGGAIFTSNVPYFSINTTCFFKCRQVLHGSCFENTGISSTKWELLSSSQCPSIDAKSYHCEMLSRGGIEESYYINCSSGSNQMVSGIYHYLTTISRINYYIVAYMNTGSLVGFGSVSSNHDYNNLVFMNNTCTNGIFHVYLNAVTVKNSYIMYTSGILADSYQGTGSITIKNSNFYPSLPSTNQFGIYGSGCVISESSISMQIYQCSKDSTLGYNPNKHAFLILFVVLFQI